MIPGKRAKKNQRQKTYQKLSYTQKLPTMMCRWLKKQHPSPKTEKTTLLPLLLSTYYSRLCFFGQNLEDKALKRHQMYFCHFFGSRNLSADFFTIARASLFEGYLISPNTNQDLKVQDWDPTIQDFGHRRSIFSCLEWFRIPQRRYSSSVHPIIPSSHHPIIPPNDPGWLSPSGPQLGYHLSPALCAQRSHEEPQGPHIHGAGRTFAA